MSKKGWPARPRQLVFFSGLRASRGPERKDDDNEGGGDVKGGHSFVVSEGTQWP